MRITNTEAESEEYRCWRCVPRTLDPEVPLTEQGSELASYGKIGERADVPFANILTDRDKADNFM
jgi:hypothetical protein